MNGERPQRFPFIKEGSKSVDPRLMGVKGANERQKKMNRLLSMKYNQRSVLDFHEAGLCGPKADLLENASKSIQDERAEMMEDPSAEYHLYWKQPPSTMFVVKKIGDPEVTKKFVEVAKWLIEERRMMLIVEPAVMTDPASKKYPELFEEHKSSLITWTMDDKESQHKVLGDADLLVCLGGDGTLLYAASLFENVVPPIVSLAMGSLGFLTSFFADSYQETIDRVLNKHVSITQRLRLECKFVSDQEVKTKMEEMCYITPPISEEEEMMKFEFAPKKPSGKMSIAAAKKQDFTSLEDKTLRKRTVVMNEVVVDRGQSPFLTNIEIFCNQRLMTTVQGDGIIVATPTGSTAYALAAGASMVHPSVSSIIICPICPHSLSFRPVVVPAGVEVMIRVSPEARNTAWVGFDGRDREELRKGDSVVITASQNPVPCVNNTGHVTDWFDSLARCLNWNVREVQKALT